MKFGNEDENQHSSASLAREKEFGPGAHVQQLGARMRTRLIQETEGETFDLNHSETNI